MVQQASFITSLVTSCVVFLVLNLVYIILHRRPGNAVIYYPLRLLRGEDAATVAKRHGAFTWIVESFRATEDDIVAAGGLDAAVYMHLFTAALEIVFFSALFCVPVLITLSSRSNYNQVQQSRDANFTYTSFDNLGMGNVEPSSRKIWAFLIGMFWVSIVTYFVLWTSYRRILNMRDRVQGSAYARPQQFVVLVRDIPKTDGKETRTEQVERFFSKVHPGEYSRVQPVHKIKPAEKIFGEREEALRKLEHAEAVWELSKKKEGGGDGKRPMHRTGFMGLWGPKVDSIDYLRDKSQELTPELEKEQRRTRQDLEKDAAFVIFKDRREATEAAQVVHAPHALKWKVNQAPEPEEVCWNSLYIPAWSRAIRRIIVNTLTVLLIVFYMIPIAFVAGLTTLENLEKLLPFIKSLLKIPVLAEAIQAYLPQLALLIFLALLPKIMLILSQAEGFASQSQVVRSASSKYFYFIIFNVFLGVTIFGAVFSNISSVNFLISQSNLSPTKVVQLFGSKLPPVASYYITYVALKFFIGYGLELSRLVPLLLFTFKRKFKCKTERELKEAWAPGAFTYHKNIASDLLILTISLCYAVIAPLILPFAIMYYALGWLIMRNQALNVHVPDWESHGSFWPHIHNRILAALLVAQITALGYFGVKQFPFTPVLVVLPIASAIFYVFCRNNYYPSIRYVSLWTAAEVPKAKPPPGAIAEAYTPACLQEGHPGIRDRRSNLATQIDSSINAVL
ncbi:hypothetical protein M758_5G129300 [Ceratodon purpureus]|nr:hypothetical protein M758_5G129300 [Ceratodon purpureus]KAG0616626.1 hypothetical protein M758_5G129300 [Ceratodon purpureus]